MDLQFSSTQNRYIKKTNRKRLTQYQVKILEMSFNANQRLQVDCRLELARRLGLPPKQVAVWYQNRRARQKIQTTEVDHKAIQLQLDSVLAENRRLEEEVGMLKFELDKAQQMLMVSTPSANLLSSLSASDDNDQASSSSPGNMICSWEDAGVLPMEELYSCLISPIGQSYKHNRNDLSIQSLLS
ncbi:hypothetical protein Dsin_031349 [Dipteronia sinensis]|uniref:Homeobox-leucine zipper protein n=1 Tax=Dipteronia sinensis TaxID=43782 RepID=A0AAD9ZLR8_9ROSI|nr:hypothetical protein Dsin_031349 [Dipteronia sinensis]